MHQFLSGIEEHIYVNILLKRNTHFNTSQLNLEADFINTMFWVKDVISSVEFSSCLQIKLPNLGGEVTVYVMVRLP